MRELLGLLQLLILVSGFLYLTLYFRGTTTWLKITTNRVSVITGGGGGEKGKKC